MKANIQAIAGGLIAVLILTLVVLNWKLFADRADINFLFGRIDAPVGLVLLCIVLALTGLQVVLLRAQKMLDRRRYSKEIERTRMTLGDEAKTSIDAMQQSVRREVAAIRSQLERIDRAVDETSTGR